MYNGFTLSPIDIFPVTIPVLQTPPSQSIPLIQQHREFRGERIETILSSYTSSLYLRLINWNKVLLVKFPSMLISVPSIIYSNNTNDNGICINMDLSTARLNVKDNKIMITDYMSFSSCILYGINKLLFKNMKDDQVLSVAFNSMCGFLYSLIIRCYIKDINMNEIQDQDIANMYYLICQLVGNQYLNVSGNLNALCTVATQRFFMKEDPKTKKKIVTARFNLDYLPRNVDVQTFDGLFSILSDMDILPNISLPDFRTRISSMFSSSLLSSLSNGLDFISMLTSLQLSSDVFNQRILSIRPISVNNINKILNKYILDSTNNISIGKNNSDVPPGW